MSIVLGKTRKLNILLCVETSLGFFGTVVFTPIHMY
jgi:hypothetical protein